MSFGYPVTIATLSRFAADGVKNVNEMLSTMLPI